MNDISKQITELSPEQLELLQRRLAEAGAFAPAPQRAPLVARTRETNTFPLSFAQQRFWFLHQLHPESFAYNIPFAATLRGTLDAAALEQTFQEIIRRHKVLNTSFIVEDGQPLQVIASTIATPLVMLYDLRGRDEREQQAEVSRLITETTQQPFDMARAPLLRVRLLRLSDERHILVLAVDHVATDAWSAGVLLQELAALYPAFAARRPSPLHELPFQYADFACWQREWLAGAELEAQLAYWRRELAGAPAGTELPTDRPRASTSDFKLATHTLQLPEALSLNLRAFAKQEEATLFILLLAAFNVVLHHYTGQTDVLVATPVSNRNRPELQGLIGCFINYLVLRTRLAPEDSFRELLGRVRETTLNAHAHQDLPFEQVVAAVQSERRAGNNPLLQIVLNVYDARLPELSLPGLQVEQLEVKLGTGSELDLRMVDTERGLVGAFRYDAALFDAETVEQLAASYVKVLETCVAAPDMKLSQFELTDRLAAKALAATRAQPEAQTIAVAATFTAEPIRDALDFWLQELHMRGEIEFAPYNQVFQQLLDPQSLFARNRRGVNVVLLRFEDWLGTPQTSAREAADADAALERNARDFIAALKVAAERGGSPFIVCLCPSSPEVEDDTDLQPSLRRTQELLVSELSGASGAYVITRGELFDLYPVTSYYDEQRDKLGHVPFSPEFFAALGTLVTRKIHALRNAPYKVIALDCDQTLWQGVVGEDGVAGLAIDAPRQELQRFLIAQQQAGMLVCLCSKNNEADVWEVFDQRADMPLRRTHLAAARINWRPKSENLSALAAELQLGLESFVFLDDDPLECAEVEANCPAVLTLRLPQVTATLPRFLKHLWAFDRLSLTAEDELRTARYQQNTERQRLHSAGLTFKDFISALDLQVEIAPLEPSQLARVSQLTKRTNQFNTTTRRRSEGDIQQVCAQPDYECHVVHVRDRFGDYGLVGVMILKLETDAVVLDSLLLSCRALGRGVEHKMLARAAARARETGRARVDVEFIRTAKNGPALDFLEHTGAAFREQAPEGFVYKLPIAAAAAVTFEPPDVPAIEAPEAPAELTAAVAGVAADASARAALLRRIATEFFDAERINRAAMERARPAKTEAVAPYVAPRTPIEEKLAEIFQQVLGVERVGIHDNFLRLGGHSLLGTLLLSRIRAALQVDVPLLKLFEGPTVAELAMAVKLLQVGEAPLDELSRLLEDLDDLSDEEIRELLEAERE
jgi:FkbH-like protein